MMAPHFDARSGSTRRETNGRDAHQASGIRRHPAAVLAFALLVAAGLTGGGLTVAPARAQDARAPDASGAENPRAPQAEPRASGRPAGGDADAVADPLKAYLERNKVYDGADFRAALAEGHRAFKNGNYDRAVREYDRAQALSEAHPVVPFCQAHALFARGDYAESAKRLIAGLDRFAAWIRLDFALAKLYPEDGKRLDAQLRALSVAAKAAGNPFALDMLLGYLRYESGRLSDARTAFWRAYQSAPTNAHVIAFLDYLAERGVGEPVTRPVILWVEPDAKTLAWLTPALKAFAARKYAVASDLLSGAALDAGDAALPWLALAFVGAAEFQSAAAIARRALARAPKGVAQLPRPADLLGPPPPARATALERTDVVLAAFVAALAGKATRVNALAAANPNEPLGAKLRALAKKRANPPQLDLAGYLAGTWKPARMGGAPPATGPGTQATPGGDGTARDPRLLSRAALRRLEEQGDAALVAGDYETAARTYSRVIVAGPGFDPKYFDSLINRRVKYQLAKARLMLGQYGPASAVLREYLGRATSLLRLQEHLFPAGLPSLTVYIDAVRELEAYVGEHSEDGAARLLAGYAELSVGNYRPAFRHLNLLAAQDPTDALVAWYREQLSQPPYADKIKPPTPKEQADKYIADARRLLAVRPNPDHAAALNLFQRAHALRATVESLTGILVCSLYQAEYRRAQSTLASYLAAKPRAAWQRVTLDLRKGFARPADYVTAVKALERHLRRKLLDYTAAYVLAFIYYFAGNYKKASETFDRYIDTARPAPLPEAEAFRRMARDHQ